MRIRTFAKTILVNDDAKVLVLRRSKSDTRRPGETDFAGGEIEPDEGIVDGAVREIREEVGIEVSRNVMQLIYTGTSVYNDSETIVNRLLYIAHIPNHQITLSFEHDQYMWLFPSEVLKDFPHPFYGEGLRFAITHKLI